MVYLNHQGMWIYWNWYSRKLGKIQWIFFSPVENTFTRNKIISILQTKPDLAKWWVSHILYFFAKRSNSFWKIKIGKGCFLAECLLYVVWNFDFHIFENLYETLLKLFDSLNPFTLMLCPCIYWKPDCIFVVEGPSAVILWKWLFPQRLNTTEHRINRRIESWYTCRILSRTFFKKSYASQDFCDLPNHDILYNFHWLDLIKMFAVIL
jgi:hypothetical protein